jgi:peptidoglycan/LPS O-acetylase OafA/YrhL
VAVRDRSRVLLRRFARSEPLSTAFVGRANSFGLLRLGFAALVLLHHSTILGYGRPIINGVDLAGLAVSGFFVISGFLITRSAERTSLPRYVWHRFLRLMPGLWACLLVTALVVAPAAYYADHHTLDDRLWFDIHGVFAYLKENWSNGGQVYGIADVFRATPYGRATGESVINGSLWSLRYEMACYAVVALVAVLGFLARARWLMLVPAAAGVALLEWDASFGGRVFTDASLMTPRLPIFGILTAQLLLPFGTMFLLGAAATLFARRIPINDVLGCAALLLSGVLLGTGHRSGLFAIAFAYTVLWAAVRLPSALHRVGARNDYSYGVYIFAFPVQQMLADAGLYRAGFVVYTAATVVLTGLAAYGSWHLVEKRALRLKDIAFPVRWLPRWKWLARFCMPMGQAAPAVARIPAQRAALPTEAHVEVRPPA